MATIQVADKPTVDQILSMIKAKCYPNVSAGTMDVNDADLSITGKGMIRIFHNGNIRLGKLIIDGVSMPAEGLLYPGDIICFEKSIVIHQYSGNMHYMIHLAD